MRYDREAAAAVLSRTPAVLRAQLEGLPEAWLSSNEEPGTWSPRDVACHMADLEQDAWLPRARWILQHGTEQPLPGVERERFRTRYAGVPLRLVLDEFQGAREANLRALHELPNPADAVGLHASMGEVTLSQLLSTWVVHDLTHLSQIVRVLAAQYRQEVGPWVQFLSVLRPRD